MQSSWLFLRVSLGNCGLTEPCFSSKNLYLLVKLENYSRHFNLKNYRSAFLTFLFIYLVIDPFLIYLWICNAVKN